MDEQPSRLKWAVLAGAVLLLLAGCTGKGGYTVSGDGDDEDGTASIGAKGTPASGLLAPLAGLGVALHVLRRTSG